MIQVTLTPTQEQMARQAAEAVNANKARLGKAATVFLKEGNDSLSIRIASFRAELAVATALGIDHPGWAVLAGGDGKIDLTLPYPARPGQTIQVKWRGEPERDLATEGLRFWDELVADIYVLTWPGLPRADGAQSAELTRPGDAGAITVVGWCTLDDFLHRIIARAPVRMRGEKWEVRWQDLHPIETLIAEVRDAHPDRPARQNEGGKDNTGRGLILAAGAAG